MSLRTRLALLIVLLTVLPAVPAALLTRQVVESALHLGLSHQVDGALEAGVRQARSALLAQRRALQHSADAWAGGWPGTPTAPGTAVDALRAARPEPPHAERVVLFDPRGEAHVVQPGGPDAARAVPGDAGSTEPPGEIMARRALSGGWALQVQRATDAVWRDDATALSSTLQVIRGLQAQREDLERAFWLPFLLIYGGAVVVGLLVAWRLGQGITAPLQRLLGATDAVAAGRWDTQVPVTAADEVGHLSRRFNAMVRTLDAQSRRLIDLETMAGWREMARALAHEVKNPLTPIQLTVEEMRERYSGEDTKYRALLDECTRIVVEEVESLRNVVTRFREFSRPVELRTRPVALNALVEDVAALQRDLDVQVDVDPNVGEIELDGDRLRQVLMNLAENARGATRGAAQPRLWLRTARHGEQVTLEVEDNGPGIPEHERERVFEPYRTGSAGGLGLGLALVKGIVLAHHGTIGVHSGRAGGACFRVELPRRQPPAASPPSDAQPQAVVESRA